MLTNPSVKYAMRYASLAADAPRASASAVALDHQDSTKFWPTCNPRSVSAQVITAIGTQQNAEDHVPRYDAYTERCTCGAKAEAVVGGGLRGCV
eukprot:79520-Chlamydomonas_euryale.AAC.3